MTTVAVLVLVFYLIGYFDRRHHLTTSLFAPRLLQAVPLAALTLALLYQIVPQVALSWEVAGSGLFLMTVAMVAWHVLAPSVIGRDALAEKILLLGDGAVARQIADEIEEAAPWGFRLAGYIPIEDERDSSTSRRGGGGFGDLHHDLGSRACAEPGNPAHARVLSFPVPVRMNARSLGRLQDLEEIILEHDVRTVVVALSDRRGKLPLASLINAKLRGVTVYDAVDFYERLTGRMLVARMRPSTIIFSEGFAANRVTCVSKRLLDLAISSTLLVLTAPLQMAIAAAIRLTSEGPALFRQERVGLAGMPFTILKYRTMREDAEKDGPQWASKNDDRITPLGRFLRKARLDELPQLWNVLAGKMSFVGPRPERPVFIRELRAAIPYYDQRHAVRPGITGWAQVKYPYGASIEETEDKLEFDLYYIKRMSLSFDVTIIFETLRVLLSGKGAR